MLKIDSTHSIDEYLALLGGDETKIYIDNDRLGRAVQEASYLATDLKELASMELAIESSGSYSYVTPDNIIDCLLAMDVDLDKRFRNKKTQGYSLDIKRVVQPLIDNGIAVDLLTAYRDYRSYSTYTSFLNGLANSRVVGSKRSDGSMILEYRTNITPRDNLRIYYSDIAVVSVPKRFSNIITSKGDGYHLAWCDYPQADWRFAYNLFIKDEANVEIMRSCEDAYEGLARMVEGDSFDLEAFKEQRKQYKVNCLSVFYNSQDKHAIPTAMREYFRSMPRYKKYFEDLSLLYEFKLPIPCTSYFGFTQMLPEARYRDAFLAKGLNTPIQTFTSEVVMETVFGILEKFWSLGYTKDDINVYYVRHDEPLFMFKDTIMKDAWIFKDCSQICVDGFTPIPLEFHFGDFYQEEDEILSSRMKVYMNSADDRLTVVEVAPQHEFQPVPSVAQLFVQTFPVKAGDITTGYNFYYYIYATGERVQSTSKLTDEIEALYETLRPIVKNLGNPEYILLRNESQEFMDRFEMEGGEEALLKVTVYYDSNVALRVDG